MRPWVELVDSLDADATVALYKRLYPQFQAAYENLGNPDSYFNDRVIEVIDHLLTAPEAPATITLARPNVLYEFADPALEAESAGRKLLLRMGPGNAARVKAKLREIRDRIAAKALAAGTFALEDLGLHREQERRFAAALARTASHPAHPAGAELPGGLSPVDQSRSHLAECRLVADDENRALGARPIRDLEERRDVASRREPLDRLEGTPERTCGFLRAPRG